MQDREPGWVTWCTFQVDRLRRKRSLPCCGVKIGLRWILHPVFRGLSAARASKRHLPTVKLTVKRCEALQHS